MVEEVLDVRAAGYDPPNEAVGAEDGSGLNSELVSGEEFCVAELPV